MRFSWSYFSHYVLTKQLDSHCLKNILRVKSVKLSEKVVFHLSFSNLYQIAILDVQVEKKFPMLLKTYFLYLFSSKNNLKILSNPFRFTSFKVTLEMDEDFIVLYQQCAITMCKQSEAQYISGSLKSDKKANTSPILVVLICPFTNRQKILCLLGITLVFLFEYFILC